MDSSNPMGPPSIEEAALLRLLRTLDGSAREVIFSRVLLAACGDQSTEPTPLSDGEWKSIEEVFWGSWPADWPGRQVVELDNLGDPGAWLEGGPGEPWLRVLFTEAHDERWAASLAESYGEKCVELAMPLPSEFAEEPVYGEVTDDDLAVFRADFVGFLKAWRERVLNAAEAQAARRNGSEDQRGAHGSV